MQAGSFGRFAVYFCIYALLWLILSQGKMQVIGAVIALLLASVSAAFLPVSRHSINWLAALKLFLFFVYNSIKGALQVSWLTLKPGFCINPYIFEFDLQTKSDFSTIMLANIYSLMPGTLSMKLSQNRIQLHIIDLSLLNERFLQRVQTTVIAAFEAKR